MSVHARTEPSRASDTSHALSGALDGSERNVIMAISPRVTSAPNTGLFSASSLTTDTGSGMRTCSGGGGGSASAPDGVSASPDACASPLSTACGAGAGRRASSGGCEQHDSRINMGSRIRKGDVFPCSLGMVRSPYVACKAIIAGGFFRTARVL